MENWEKMLKGTGGELQEKETLQEQLHDEHQNNEEAQEQQETTAKSMIKEVLSWGVTLLIAFGLAILLKNYVIINATVPTGSMEHTIEPGDDLFGMRLTYKFSEPSRGDIIIFRFPDDETQKTSSV